MDPKHWLDKKPSAIRDWLGMAFLCIACVIVLSQLGALLAQAGALLRLAAPFGWAAVLAYVLDTLVRPLHRFLFRGRPGLRWAAILAAYVLAGLAVFLLVWLVVPQVVASVTAFFRGLPDSVAALQRTLAGLEARYGVSLKPLIEALEDYEQWMASLSAALGGGVPGLVGAVGNLAAYAVQIVVALAGSLFMLADKDHLLLQLRVLVRALLPRRAATMVLDLCRFANQTFAGFFFGKIVASAIIGLALCAVMSVLGLSYAPMLSVLVAFANLIPIFGMYMGALPGVVILLFVDPLQAVVFLVLVIALQQLDIRCLAPNVLGHASGLSAFWVLFAIVAGAWLWGPAGMVLGVPAFATVYGVLRRCVYWLLARRGQAGPEDQPPAEQPEQPAEQQEEKELAHV